MDSFSHIKTSTSGAQILQFGAAGEEREEGGRADLFRVKTDKNTLDVHKNERIH